MCYLKVIVSVNNANNDIKRQIDNMCRRDINQPHTKFKLILKKLL